MQSALVAENLVLDDVKIASVCSQCMQTISRTSDNEVIDLAMSVMHELPSYAVGEKRKYYSDYYLLLYCVRIFIRYFYEQLWLQVYYNVSKFINNNSNTTEAERKREYMTAQILEKWNPLKGNIVRVVQDEYTIIQISEQLNYSPRTTIKRWNPNKEQITILFVSAVIGFLKDYNYDAKIMMFKKEIIEKAKEDIKTSLDKYVIKDVVNIINDYIASGDTVVYI